MEETKLRSEIVFFSKDRGFGFIASTDGTEGNYFFHVTNLENFNDGILPNEGDFVEFLPGVDELGRKNAKNVKIIESIEEEKE